MKNRRGVVRQEAMSPGCAKVSKGMTYSVTEKYQNYDDYIKTIK